jgi:hypothetical protein
MTAYKWVVMLLACNLIGLFEDTWVTAAPAYDSIESQNSDAIDSTYEDTKDDVISNTHEEGAVGNSGNETAEKGDGNVINTGGQEAENGGESEHTDGHSEISSNPHAEGISGDETAEKGEGNVINTGGQEAENGGESEHTDEHSEISSDPHAEEISGDETAEKEDGNVINTGDQEAENGGESEHTDEHSEISSDPHANDDAEEAENVSDEEEGGHEENSPKEYEDSYLHGLSPEEENKNIHDSEVDKEDVKEASHESEQEGSETNEEITNTETDGSNDHSLPDDDKTEHHGNVESEEKADSSSSEVNQDPSPSSEQEISDEDRKSSGSTEAPDSDVVGGGGGNSNSLVSESPVTISKAEEDNDDDGNDNDDDDDDEEEEDDGYDDDSDRGSVAKDEDDNVSDSAEPANEEESTGDHFVSIAVHAAAAHVDTEEVTTEVNKNDDTELGIDEPNFPQEDDSSTEAPDDAHGVLGSSSEHGAADQNNSAEGNNSEASESSIQETNEKEEEEEEEEKDDDDDDDDILKEGGSGTETSDEVHQVTSSEVGTEDQNLSVESSSQIDGSYVKPDTEGNAQSFSQVGRLYKPFDNITSNNEASANCNCSTKNADVPVTTEMSQKTAENGSNVAANATENLGENEDKKFWTSVENAVTISETGSENKTLVGTRVQKGDIKEGGGDDGINEPGLGSHQGNSESSGSLGSYIVLGVIMAIIIALFGYSMIKGKSRRSTRVTKNEDFGTEMSDVKKNLLPRNEFKGDIQPNARIEIDESRAKLLPDAQRTGDNVQNGEAGVTVQKGTESQKGLGRIDGAPTEKKFDFDKIETQVEPLDLPENTLNSQNQYSTNPFRQAVTPKKQETADGQTTHHQSMKTPTHQKAHNNVNGFPEAVVEKVPVQTYSGYVTQNSGVPAVHSGLQQQNMSTVYSLGPPIKVVTVVEEGCVPTKPVIINM